MTTFENLSPIQKLRAAVHRDTKLICSETCHFLGLEITKPAAELIAELLYKKLSVFATDLEAFAKHAKRQTINSDDVKLLVRRNPYLLTHITEAAGNTNKEKKRKTITTSTVVDKTVAADVTETAKSSDASVPLKAQDNTTPLKQNDNLDLLESNICDDNMIDLTFD